MTAGINNVLSVSVLAVMESNVSMSLLFAQLHFNNISTALLSPEVL